MSLLDPFIHKPKSKYHITTPENAEFAVTDFLEEAERTNAETAKAYAALPPLGKWGNRIMNAILFVMELFFRLYRWLLFKRWGVKG